MASKVEKRIFVIFEAVIEVDSFVSSIPNLLGKLLNEEEVSNLIQASRKRNAKTQDRAGIVEGIGIQAVWINKATKP